MSSIAFAPKFCNHPFHPISQAFLDDPTLAFAKVLPAEVVEATFRKYDALFEGTFYNTAIVLWEFISQVLADGKGKRLGKDDVLVTWMRPQCPSCMSVEEYEQIPMNKN